MEAEHKDFIDKNYMLFTELLRLKSVPLIRYMYDEQVLSEKEATKTMSQAALTLKTMHLLDHMLNFGAEAFNSLYAAILYTKLWKAADLLEPKNRPHKDIYEIPQIPLPDKWPDENYCKEIENKELEIKKVDPEDGRMEEWYEQPRKNNIYDMKQKIKGRALIINNHKFKKQTKRLGSQKDVEGLINVFTKLGFDPDAHEDLTYEQMKVLLQQECKKDHTDYNCFFLIIMTHGHKGIVYGTDGYKDGDKHYNCLYIEDIKNQFYEVKSLERKPKVFIIQACQGSGKDAGLKGKEAPNDDEDEEGEEEETHHDGESQAADNGNQAAEGGNLASTEGDNEGGNDEEENMSGDDDSGEEMEDAFPRSAKFGREDDGITEEAPYHFLVALATTEGNLSYRNTTYGSWFIQAFIFVLATYAWKEDLLTLMEKVNELVRRARTEKTKRNPKAYLQVSQITTSFIKRFFFFPGMPLETKKKKTAPPMPVSQMPGALKL